MGQTDGKLELMAGSVSPHKGATAQEGRGCGGLSGTTLGAADAVAGRFLCGEYTFTSAPDIAESY